MPTDAATAGGAARRAARARGGVPPRLVTPVVVAGLAATTAAHLVAPAGSWHYFATGVRVLFATPGGRWHRFATLELAAAPGPLDDDTLRFDPIINPLPGARTYEWTRVLREPSYATARHGSA